MEPKVAILIPCLDEELAIVNVVTAFRAAMPAATVFVYDNGSSDQTVEVARAAGAVVRREPLRGKGNVVRRMFADIDADVYVLVDGDDTYDARSCPMLVRTLLEQQLDMVNGARISDARAAYRTGHRLGKALLTGIVARMFGNRIKDMLSGHRVFSRRYVKSFPAFASGFETETELTVHALELRMPIAEVQTPYRERPAVFEEFARTGLVPRLPSAVLSTGLMILAFLSLGLILDSVARGRREFKRFAYLSIPSPRDVTGTGARPPVQGATSSR